MANRISDGPVTKEVLNEAVEAIFEGVDKIIKGLRSEMSTRFENTDEKK